MQQQCPTAGRASQLQLQTANRTFADLSDQSIGHEQVENVIHHRLDPCRREVTVNREQRMRAIYDPAVASDGWEPHSSGRGCMLMRAEEMSLAVEPWLNRIHQRLSLDRHDTCTALIHYEFLTRQRTANRLVRHDEITVPIRFAKHAMTIQRMNGIIAQIK